MTYNAKQGLQAVVAKQGRTLPNDVIFGKTKNVKIKEEGSMIVYRNIPLYLNKKPLES